MSPSDHNHHWTEQFAQERSRLLTALGELTEGGVVENLQHIGATSVPGLPASACLDIGLSIWPFPLAPERRAALESSGYSLIAGYEEAPEQRFRHVTGACQLYIVEAGSELWTDYLLIRDYLRNDGDARQVYSTRKQTGRENTALEDRDGSTAKAQLFLDLLPPARQWWVAHHGFGPVEAVAAELEAFDRPWYVSSGWALDLFLGRTTRVHHDVDIVTARTDQLALQQYMTGRGWKFVAPLQGRLEPWPPHMRLELPRHQAHAHREGKFIDFLLSEIEAGIWRFRREPAVIRAVERLSLSTAEGLPFLAPEIVLLFKSKNTSGKERSKDEVDFQNTYPHLEPERRAWLRWALTVVEPGHPWMSS